MRNNSQQPLINNNCDQLLSIPTKICDGIFMADQLISQDIQWLQMNQVTHIINCAGKHSKNTNRLNGVNFLTYQWSQNNIQNIIEQNVIGAAITFIQQAKKQCGSVLVHCYQSQSRPFCILASYLMIRYQWNLFKTLQYLNSRKQDIQLEPGFFQQLTSLHQKLQQKGLIKSRNWNRDQNMSDQELILTNTFLNAKRKPSINNQNTKQQKKPKNKQPRGKKVTIRQQMSQVHVYLTQTILAQLNPQRNNILTQKKQNLTAIRNPSKDKQDSVYSSKDTDNQIQNIKMKQQSSNPFKQNPRDSKTVSEANVTKRWAQLRQSWNKEKQNNQLLQNQPQNKITCNFCLQF